MAQEPAEKIIGKYRLIRRLGTGGMGEVWLAEDTELQRSVAVKIMTPELAKDENQRKRFRTEARAASALNHPNICVIHEVGQAEDGRPFLAMEYIEGETLAHMRQERHLRVREVLRVGIQVAGALEAAHARQIVHRDIKPSNIMLDSRGQAKVLDFGLAKSVAHSELAADATTSAVTKTGFLIGTPHYMSPEQVLGRELDPRTDLFSLGIVLYELLAGQRPFLGRTVGEVITSIASGNPEPLGLENPLYSPALDRVIFKCLEKEPRNRYPTAGALAEELRQLKDQAERAAAVHAHQQAQGPMPGQPHEAATVAAAAAENQLHRGPDAPPSRRWPAWAALAGGASAVILATIAFLLWHHHLIWQGRPGASPTATLPDQSVAVLPFDNFSGEPDTDYLSDGLTEEITSALSRVPGLKVAARTSAFTFKGKNEDVRKVGQMLHVATVLEGSIRKSDNQIRVTAELISASDGLQLWSETYDRPINDIIPVQEEIASRIAERLRGKTTAQVKRQAVSPEAYKLYSQARMAWNKRTGAGLRKALELYQQAIEKEPDYAAAHAGLAATYLLLPEYTGTARMSDYRPLVQASAKRALELDPSCAEAYAVLGSLAQHGPECKSAGGLFLRAIQLDPNYATAHHWYGLYLEMSGNRDEGLREFQKALDLDPLSPIIHSTIPEWYYEGRDFDRAIREARAVIEKFPDFPPARLCLVEALVRRELYKDALVEIEAARTLVPDQPLLMLDQKGFCLARLGQEAEARSILDDLAARTKEGKPLESAMAHIYLGLRDYDKALALIEQVRRTEGFPPEMFQDPSFDEIRNRPEFQALVARAAGTNAPAL